MINKHIKRYSAISVIREIKIKSTIEICFTLTRRARIKKTVTSLDEEVEKL